MLSDSPKFTIPRPGFWSAVSAFFLAAALPSVIGALVMELIGCMTECRMPASIVRGVTESFLGLFGAYAAPSSLLFGVPAFLISREKIAPTLKNACCMGALLGFLPQGILISIALLAEGKNPIVTPLLFCVFGAPLGALGGLIFWVVALRNALPSPASKTISKINPSPLPEGSLLLCYREAGAYTDCYRGSLPQRVSLAEFVEAFYTGWLFKIERFVLTMILFKPSSDAQAKQLANAETAHFSLWSVESRTDHQLLLCDMFGHTRSWLMCVDGADGSAQTHLYFGSAVIPRLDRASGRQSFGLAFHLLGGFHNLYSRALLRQAISRLNLRA